MRILGLDLGSRTLGIALSDTQAIIASAKETFRFAEDDYDAAIERTLAYIDRYDIKTVVLGLPKHMNGDLGIRAQISLEFKEILEKERAVAVILVDERLTTVIANRTLTTLKASIKNKKAKVDQLAAVEILQSYLDRKKEHDG